MNSATLAGPPAHLVLGHTRDLAHDRLGSLTRWAREYGDIVPLRFANRRAFLLNHPDLVAEVLLRQRDNFIRTWLVRSSRLTFGDSMLVSSGQSWKRKRRLAQPSFHHKATAQYAQWMTSFTKRMLAAWDDGEHINLHDEFMRLTLAIVAKALFGADVQDDAPTVRHVMTAIQDGFTARMDNGLPLPDSVPLPANLRMRRALRQLDQIIYRVIADARVSTDGQAHLVSLLLGASDEHGNRLSDREIRDESVTFFLAGHETTALALTWAMYLLAEHPHVEARLHGELDTLAGRPPSLEDVPNLPYTAAVVREAMRLYPPTYVMGRDAIAPCRLGDVNIPAGASVIWSQWVLQRDPRYWDRPETFDPDRWEDERVKSLPRFVYFPFGGGPQQCIGASFATLEATLILATVAQRFRLRLQPGHEVVPQAQITLRPRGGMPMILHARAPAPAGVADYFSLP